MPLHVASRRRSAPSLAADFPGSLLLDVTSKGQAPWQRFSPFYPHGGIPVPFSPGAHSESVEGVWQGLKVFASADVDVTKFANRSLSGLKRTVRTCGAVLGHRAGVAGQELLSYRDARFQIHLPTYHWVLTDRLQPELEELRALSSRQGIVLLDYETNGDLENLAKPLSHASLIVRFLEGTWPIPGAA